MGDKTATFKPMSVEEMARGTVGELIPLNGPVELSEYDPQWLVLYDRECARIGAALGERALMVEHVGSTSVPLLAAKPRIDILLIVPNSAYEAAYIPDLESAGYVLRGREPDWYEHRLFNRPDIEVNVHVFSPGCVEIERMLSFRNWLRTHPEDRDLYERTKRELAAQQWEYTQNYADSKTAVVEEIIARANAGAVTRSAADE